MPNFMSSISVKDLTQADLMFAIQQSMADEHEAAMRYIQIAEATKYEKAKTIFLDIAHEETVHAGEFRELYKRLFPDEYATEEDGEKEAKRILDGEKTESEADIPGVTETVEKADIPGVTETVEKADKIEKKKIKLKVLQ